MRNIINRIRKASFLKYAVFFSLLIYLFTTMGCAMSIKREDLIKLIEKERLLYSWDDPHQTITEPIEIYIGNESIGKIYTILEQGSVGAVLIFEYNANNEKVRLCEESDFSSLDKITQSVDSKVLRVYYYEGIFTTRRYVLLFDIQSREKKRFKLPKDWE